MSDFKYKLKELFNEIDSKDVLLALKENFIITLKDKLDFSDEYNEEAKKAYFNNFNNYIQNLKYTMDNQIKISNLKLSELYKVIEYQSIEDILCTLEYTLEYFNNKYIEIDLHKGIVIKDELRNDIKQDLEKVDLFLNRLQETDKKNSYKGSI